MIGDTYQINGKPYTLLSVDTVSSASAEALMAKGFSPLYYWFENARGSKKQFVRKTDTEKYISVFG